MAALDKYEPHEEPLPHIIEFRYTTYFYGNLSEVIFYM